MPTRGTASRWTCNWRSGSRPRCSTTARWSGSCRRSWPRGLNKGKRHHVHLSKDVETARKVGARRGKPVILKVDAGRMHRDGHTFFLSANGVWLTDAVPPGLPDGDVRPKSHPRAPMNLDPSRDRPPAAVRRALRAAPAALARRPPRELGGVRPGAGAGGRPQHRLGLQRRPGRSSARPGSPPHSGTRASCRSTTWASSGARRRSTRRPRSGGAPGQPDPRVRAGRA